MDELTIVKWIGGIVLMLLGGMGYRRLNSRVSAEVARDGVDRRKAEGESTYVEDLKTDRDNWRLTAEEGFAQIKQLSERLTRIEGDFRHWKRNFDLRVGLFRRQNPGVDISLLIMDSGPVPLDEK